MALTRPLIVPASSPFGQVRTLIESGLPIYGTAAELTAGNLTLGAGQVGMEIDTGKAKIGDGVTAWIALEYVGADGEGVDLDSPAFTGTPTAPTATAGNSTTRLATTAFVQAALAVWLSLTTRELAKVAGFDASGTPGTQDLDDLAEVDNTIQGTDADGEPWNLTDTVLAAWVGPAMAAYLLANGIGKWHEPVRAVATANGTLASAFENGDSLDGITLATGNRILLTGQSTGADNGVYIVAASGAPTRALDGDADAELRGAVYLVLEGTAGAGSIYQNTNASAVTVGSTVLTYAALVVGSGGGGVATSSKLSVRAATTANGTLASAFENGDTLDGITLATGDRILLKNQTAGDENGIYTVSASGAPARASDADTAAEVLGLDVFVREGTTNAGTKWANTNTSITLGSTALTFALIAGREAQKLSVRAATTGNGTLASAYENTDTLDGITLATGDRILLKDQTTGADNGIYLVQATGAPVRATDYDIGAKIRGTEVYVREGTLNGGSKWVNTNTSAPTVGSTSLTYARSRAPLGYTAVAPSGGNVAINGAAVTPNISVAISGAIDFNSITNLVTGLSYEIEVSATGGPFAVTATGAGRTFNFGAGISIPSGKGALFVIKSNGSQSTIAFCGYRD